MATADSNGLVLIDGSDSIQPLHPVLNAITQSVSDAFNQTTRIYPVTSIAARTALYERVGASPDRPLMVWYSLGATGRQLMYTRGGNGESNWKYYSSSEDTATSQIWRVANITGRTAIFNAVGPGTTASPVMVWRADAPAGRNLEYNVTSSNAVANWHSYSSSQYSDDTGWVQIPGSPSPEFKYRIRDSVLCEVTIRVLGTYPAGGVVFPLITLPQFLRPNQVVALAGYGGGGHPITAHLGTNGNINVRNNHSAATNEFIITGMFFLG